MASVHNVLSGSHVFITSLFHLLTLASQPQQQKLTELVNDLILAWGLTFSPLTLTSFVLTSYRLHGNLSASLMSGQLLLSAVFGTSIPVLSVEY